MDVKSLCNVLCFKAAIHIPLSHCYAVRVLLAVLCQPTHSWFQFSH